MSSSISELYMVQIPRNLLFRDEFINYLHSILNNKLQERLTAVLNSPNPPSTSVTLREDNLPSIPNRDKVQVQEMQTLQISPELDEDKPMDTEDSAISSLESAKERKDDLETVDPLNFEHPPVELTTSVENLLNGLLKQVHYFTVVMRGEDCGDYFGISREELYANTLFNATYVMRTIDFGSDGSHAFYLFYPAFLSLKENLIAYYNEFLKRKEDFADGRVNDVNN